MGGSLSHTHISWPILATPLLEFKPRRPPTPPRDGADLCANRDYLQETLLADPPSSKSHGRSTTVGPEVVWPVELLVRTATDEYATFSLLIVKNSFRTSAYTAHANVGRRCAEKKKFLDIKLHKLFAMRFNYFIFRS